MKIKFQTGLTLVELLVAISIVSVLSIVVLTLFISLRDNQVMTKNTETIVAVLRQARDIAVR